MEAVGDVSTHGVPPYIQLPGNASSFAIYSHVRMEVLEFWMKEACEIYLASSSCLPSHYIANESESEEDEVDADKEQFIPLRIPKVFLFINLF